MEYECLSKSGKRTTRWTGELRLLHKEQDTYEVEITGRGSYFHVITGSHRYGKYLCIPNHDIGSELAGYLDVFWNQERLSRQLKKVDALTVAYGLSHLKEL